MNEFRDMNKVRYVNITIYDVSAELLHEFSEKILKPYYPGGISVAIRDLMRKAVEGGANERKEGPNHDSK